MTRSASHEVSILDRIAIVAGGERSILLKLVLVMVFLLR